MTTSSWWQLVLLALAAFRITRLVGWDDLTITPRRWLTGLGDTDHEALAEHVDDLAERGIDAWQTRPAPLISKQRFYLSRMIRCPWCFGWWCSLTIWIAWEAWPHAIFVAAAPFAISALVGLVAKNLDE
jgi:hypothetical protein